MSVDSLASLQRIQGTFSVLAPAAKSTDDTTFATLMAALRAQEAQAATLSSTSTSSATGDSIVKAAEGYLGVPYVFGGTSNEGLDCTGLVQKSLGDAGITVGRSMDEQMTSGTDVGTKLADAKPGDVIVLNGGSHSVIYAGDGNVIHAPYEGRTVTKQQAWFDDSEIVTIRRFAPEQQAAPVAAQGYGSLGTSATSFSEALQSLMNAQAAIFARSIS